MITTSASTWPLVDLEPRSRHLMMLEVTGDLLGNIFQEGWYGEHLRCTQGLPRGAKFVGGGYDPERGTLKLVYEHESFPEVYEGNPINTMVALFESSVCPAKVRAAVG